MVKKRVLVTGGAGFLGSHLCSRLVHDHEVICVDNFSSGDKKNIASLLNHSNFELIEHDICRTLYLEVDQIYNLASPASPIEYQKDPVQTAKTSVVGSLNLLELAKRSNAKILQASTSEVYGDPNEHPQKENYWGNVNPIGIRACYDEGKRCAETLFFDFHRKHHLKIKVVRIFNTYGPNMRGNEGRVVSNFISQALDGKPLTIYGTGDQTRSFCYVDDLIDGLIAMMNSDNTFTGPVNLGNPEEFSVLGLAELILSMTKSKSKMVFRPLPLDDPRQRKPDISLAKKHLQWSPQVSLREGLEKTIAYFQEQHDYKEEDILSSLI